MIRAIIFDIGEVLQIDKGDKEYEKLAEEFGVNLKDVKKFIAPYLRPKRKMNMRARGLADAFRKEFEIKKDVLPFWRKIYRDLPLNKELFVAISKLRKKYKIVALSNAHEVSAENRRKNKISSYFDIMILSSEVGLPKPGKEIFRLALRKLRLKPEECLFIDDKEENLVDPKEIGFHTIIFKSNKQLLRKMKSLGIKF